MLLYMGPHATVGIDVRSLLLLLAQSAPLRTRMKHLLKEALTELFLLAQKASGRTSEQAFA